MLSRQFHIKTHLVLAISIAFCLPIARLTPLFIALMLLNWLIEGDFKNKFQLIFKNKFALLFLSFYIIHLFGLFYSQNIDSGLFDIQVKFSFFVFPLVIASRPFTKENVQSVFFALIAGAIVSSIAMLTRALLIYYSTGENNFYYEAFSFLIHPSYLAMYLNLAIAWLLLSVVQKKIDEWKYAKLIVALIVVFFSFILLLLSSKLGLITNVLMYVGFLFHFIISRKKYAIGFVALLIIPISFFFVMRFVPELSGRINRAVSAVTSPKIDNSEIESTAVRVLVWKAANRVISENLLLGVGTGDAKDALMVEYKKRGMTGALKLKLNAHNEYYQVFLALGVLGFSLFLANLFFPLFFAFKEKNVIFILFLLLVMLNFLVESMFETQAGVMFYAFFNSLLCFCLNPKSEIKNPK